MAITGCHLEFSCPSDQHIFDRTVADDISSAAQRSAGDGDGDGAGAGAGVGDGDGDGEYSLSRIAPN